MAIKITEQTSDEQIVIYTREKDKEFFAYIIDRYERKLGSYIHRWIVNSDDVDDLLQQTFINVYVNLNSFMIEKKFSSWIYRIAHNVVMNWLKKRKQHLSLDEEFLVERVLSNIDLAKEINNNDLKIALAKAIDKLPLKFQEPFVLKFLEDKSYEEISDILRKPKNTVGTLISRAKELLIKELK